jgi:hypothetical protein
LSADLAKIIGAWELAVEIIESVIFLVDDDEVVDGDAIGRLRQSSGGGEEQERKRQHS